MNALPAPDRRRLLLAGLSSLGALGLSSRAAHATGLAWWAAPESEGEVLPTLVLLQLSGGNDGLNTVIPFDDDDYHRRRSRVGVGRGEGLRLDDYRAFNPALERLRARYLEGGLAIVEGVGYPEPNRSHFKSLDIWHTGDARGRAAGEGWVGRLTKELHGDAYDPCQVVHVGAKPSYALHSSTHPPSHFSTPADYRWEGNQSDVEAYADRTHPGTTGNASLDHVRRALFDALDSSNRIRRAAARHRPEAEYPSTSFGQALRSVAAMIHGSIGLRVASLELTGFDTHTEQSRKQPALLRALDEGLSALLDDLATSEAGRRAVVMVFSEFGRRVAENFSGGTDHGTAGPVFLAGGDVRGGLYGKHPDLGRLDPNGDLRHTTDFRSIYGTLIDEHFGLHPRDVLGKSYPKLKFLG